MITHPDNPNQEQSYLNLFDDFKKLFVQRIPSYIVQMPGEKGWHTRQSALPDSQIEKHLAGLQWVGCLSRWYPEYCQLDFDDKPLQKVEEIRDELGLDSRNSMLFRSPSPDSYHLYLRPEYNGKPPTVNLLQAVFRAYVRDRGLEIWPQRNRGFRLPFGKGQDCLDAFMRGWEEKLFWLKRKDSFDLSTVKDHQEMIIFPPILPRVHPLNDLDPGVDIEVLLKEGLQGPSTRDQAQFQIIRHLYRQNVNLEEAGKIVWNWLKIHHNGFSKDFQKRPLWVKENIQHQVTQYYSKMESYFTLPDRPHLTHKGYICKPDLLTIVQLCQGNLPRMRFTFELVRYMNPRRYRESVPIHRDKLVAWSSWRSYLENLHYLEDKGILERGSGFIVGEKSKPIKLKWPYKTDKEAVLWGERSVETLEKAVQLTFKPSDFKELLGHYLKKNTAFVMTKRLFEGIGTRVTNGDTLIHDSAPLALGL